MHTEICDDVADALVVEQVDHLQKLPHVTAPRMFEGPWYGAAGQESGQAGEEEIQAVGVQNAVVKARVKMSEAGKAKWSGVGTTPRRIRDTVKA